LKEKARGIKEKPLGFNLRVLKVRGTPRLYERDVKEKHVRKGTHKETIANLTISVNIFLKVI
jgi:hypothetical protein